MKQRAVFQKRMYRNIWFVIISEVSQSGKIVLKSFEKLDVKDDTENVEVWYQLKPKFSSKRKIIKLSKRKDSEKVHAVKKNMEISKVNIDWYQLSYFHKQ